MKKPRINPQPCSCADCGIEHTSVAQIVACDDLPMHDAGIAFINCLRCSDERPDDVSPREWARFSVALTERGLQVFCTRHDLNVVHIDFEGCVHPAATGCIHPPKRNALKVF